MSNTKTFTVAAASSNRINVYDAMTGSIHRVITLGGQTIVGAPVVFGDGFTVSVSEGGQTYMLTYGFPLCNIKSKSHVS